MYLSQLEAHAVDVVEDVGVLGLGDASGGVGHDVRLLHPASLRTELVTPQGHLRNAQRDIGDGACLFGKRGNGGVKWVGRRTFLCSSALSL